MKKTVNDIKTLVLNGTFQIWQDFASLTATFDNQEFTLSVTGTGTVWFEGDGYGSPTNYGCGSFTMSLKQIEKVLGYKLYPTPHRLKQELNEVKEGCIEISCSINKQRDTDFFKALLESDFHYETLSKVLCLTASKRDFPAWKILYNKVKADIIDDDGDLIQYLGVLI